MYPFGRRQPPPDRPGIYLSQWWPRDLISQIDDLADFWGVNRSQTIKRAVADAHEAERKKGLKAKLRKRRG